MHRIDFQKLLVHEHGTKALEKVFSVYDKSRNVLFKRWYEQTGEFEEIYPSQGLLKTPYDFLEHLGKTLMPEDEL